MKKLRRLGASSIQDPQRTPTSGLLSASGTQRPFLKLEKLKLEKFDGTHERWTSWWTRFKQRIEDDPTLNDLDRFDYLNQYLGKEAKEKIKDNPPEFYKVAIKRLREEFGNEVRLREIFTDRLMHLTPVQSRYDVQALRGMLQTVKLSITSLEALGIHKRNIANFFLKTFKAAIRLDPAHAARAGVRAEKIHPQGRECFAESANGSLERRGSQITDLTEFIERQIQYMATLDPAQLKPHQESHQKPVKSTANFFTNRKTEADEEPPEGSDWRDAN